MRANLSLAGDNNSFKPSLMQMLCDIVEPLANEICLAAVT